MAASPDPGGPGSSLPPTLRTRSRVSTPGCCEAPRGLLAPPGLPGLCTWLRVQRVPGWDSGDLVDPFMRAGTYPARHLATLRESELLPAFGGASPGCTRVSRTASGQDSAPVLTLSGSRGPMFLLNSRVPLVTATCGPRGMPQDRRHPFSRSYGANLPSSLAWVTPPRLGLFTQGHLCRFSVRAWGSFPAPFSRAPGVGGTRLTAGPSRLHPLLAMTALSGLQRLDGTAVPLPLSRGVRSGARVAAKRTPRQGNINPFPFRRHRLRAALGPANPQPTTVAEEPLPFRRRGFSPLLRSYYRRDFHSRRIHRTSRPGFQSTWTPPYRITPQCGVPRGLGGRLSPGNLRGPPPRRVSCYALLSRWLLLSLRPRCLRRGTPFWLDTLAGTWGP